jgi:hypothetical protein
MKKCNLRINQTRLRERNKAYSAKHGFKHSTIKEEPFQKPFHPTGSMYQATSKPHADHRACKVNRRMKTWKIVLVVALATLATGLVVASAFAYGRPATAQYGTNNGAASPYGGYTGGMMRSGMMGNGYSRYNGLETGTNGYGGCTSGVRGWP